MSQENQAAYERSTTLSDEDLRQPQHDEILLWLDTNMTGILNRLIYPDLTDEQIESYLENPAEIKKNWQQPIKGPSGEIIGFVDIIVSYERSDESSDTISKVFFFDVRTAIPSLGELIREINTYKLYLGFEQSWMYTYLVVCADDRYADILAEQGIHFLPYSPDTTR